MKKDGPGALQLEAEKYIENIQTKLGVKAIHRKIHVFSMGRAHVINCKSWFILKKIYPVLILESLFWR